MAQHKRKDEKRQLLTPSSLNDDELDVVFQYLNVQDVSSINTLSLVNKRFFSLATSDRYWTEFDDKVRTSKPFQSPPNKAKRALLIQKRRKSEHFDDIRYDRRFNAGCTLLLCSFLLSVLAGTVLLILYSSEIIFKSASCHQYSTFNSTEIIYNVIPFPNTTCIPCERNLRMCNTSNSFYPCCVELSNCTYDKTPTGFYKWTFEIMTEIIMQVGNYKFNKSTQYKCGDEEHLECNPFEYENRYFDCYYDRVENLTTTPGWNTPEFGIFAGFAVMGVIIMIISIGIMWEAVLRGVISYCIVELGLADEYIGQEILIYSSKDKLINYMLIITGLNYRRRKKHRVVKTNKVASIV